MNHRLGATVLGAVLGITFVYWIPGRLDWTRGWLLVALVSLVNGGTTWFLARRNPELLRRRSRIGPGTRRWDKWVWLPVTALLYLAILIVGALDSGRFGWSTVAMHWWPVGAVTYTLSMLFITRCMDLNPFFESTARIQHDQGHHVIDSGPYAVVRHPAYAAFAFGINPSMPLLLGSWWVAIPAALCSLWILVRVELEDRLLRDGLDGYVDYVRRVPHKLLPAIY